MSSHETRGAPFLSLGEHPDETSQRHRLVPTEKSMASEMNSAPGGTVTSPAPANVSALSVAGSISELAGERGRAMWTDVKCNASVPKAFERCTRTLGPPSER